MVPFSSFDCLIVLIVSQGLYNLSGLSAKDCTTEALMSVFTSV